MRAVLAVVVVLSSAHDACGDGASSLRGSSGKQNRTLEAEASVGACSPDPHCGWKGDKCHCCWDNGGCDFEQACKCRPACFDNEGAFCTDGDTALMCYETKGECELAHKKKPLKFLEAPLGTCSPDPHCSWKADKCHCCYNGGCDFEQACKCGHAPPQHTCNPDPHCTHEGEKCKCCYNGGCDYEDVCKCGGPAIASLSSHLEESDMVSEDSRERNSTGMKALASSVGCWSSNGAICQYVFGESDGCYETAAACFSATGKPSACFEYNGAICEWTIGDTPSNCYETKGHCELAHVITPLKFLEAPLGTCSPDPHCSWKADKCHCCYNGGCDFEQACKCGHAPPQHTCNPDPHCTHEGEKCKCCYNGGCDYEDLCKCGGPAIAPLNSHLEESHMVSEDSRERNSTGMKALASSFGCWTSNGAVCLYVFGESDGCYATAAACSSATGKPPGCFEYVGGTCVWTIGDTPSNCFETKGHCEIAHAITPLQPLPQCVAFNGECGGLGRPTRPCCIDGFSCKKPNYLSEVMICMA